MQVTPGGLEDAPIPPNLAGGPDNLPGRGHHYHRTGTGRTIGRASGLRWLNGGRMARTG